MSRKSNGKKSDCNLLCGPRTRSVRGIYKTRWQCYRFLESSGWFSSHATPIETEEIGRQIVTWPFPSCFEPHYESEAKCKTFYTKISFVCRWTKTYFRNKNFALSLSFKMTLKATRKYPIGPCNCQPTNRANKSVRVNTLRYIIIKLSTSLLYIKYRKKMITERRSRINGPFAANGHMVQNPPCWRASYALGHAKQSIYRDVLSRDILST